MTAPSALPNPTGTVITVAPTGTRDTGDVPRLPVSAEAVASAAADCERIGASAIELEPRHEVVLAEVVAAVRAQTNLLVRVAAHARSESLRSLVDCGADVLGCPLDAPAEFIADVRADAEARGIAVHYEARTLTQLDILQELSAKPVHVVLVFDEHDMPGDVHTFSGAVDRLPTGSTFSATGIGTASVPVMLMALAAGGHLRVGLSDTVDYSEGVAVRDNAQLVARAAGLAKIAQRPPLAPSAAAGVVGIGT